MNTPTTPQSDADQTAERRRFLGGSDAAAVLGVSPYSTPVELWRKKTGRVTIENEDPKRKKILSRGHRLEPFIRDMTVERLQDMGLLVSLVRFNERYQDREHPFLAAEIDFELMLSGEVEINGVPVVFDHELVNCDAKSVSGFAVKKWGEEGTEDVPIEYAAQFMHGLMVTGRRYCIAAALRSFDDVDIYWTVRDDETIAAMREKEVAFWTEHVVADVPPDPLRFNDIKLIWPTDNGQAVEASDEIAEAVDRLRYVKATIKDLESEEEALNFKIGEFISPHALLRHQGIDLATWKAQSMKILDEKALKQHHPDIAQQFTVDKTIRVLRLKKPKAPKGTA